MPTFKEAAFYVENGVTYYFKDTKAREQLKECFSPSNPPPTPSGVLPPGGTTGQIPKKRSNVDYDVAWEDESVGDPTNTWYATCSTSSGVGAKTATSATGDFVLATGAMVRVLFSNSNTAANPTISIDGSTAKNIRPVSGASGMDYMWKAGEVIDIVYDGSNFVMTKGGKADTSFYGITKLDSSTNSTATNVAATPKAVKDVKDMIPAASSATPQDLGTAAAGSSADYSRADHVHNKPTYTKSDVGLGNVDNVQQYSASNPPPYPVASVNGLTGDVVLPTGGRTLLWSNPNPSSSFASQTILLPSHSHTAYQIICKFRYNADYSLGPFEGLVGESLLMNSPACSNITSGSFTGFILRLASTSAGQIVFGTGEIAYNTGTTNNDYMIPLRVYGID